MKFLIDVSQLNFSDRDDRKIPTEFKDVPPVEPPTPYYQSEQVCPIFWVQSIRGIIIKKVPFIRKPPFIKANLFEGEGFLNNNTPAK